MRAAVAIVLCAVMAGCTESSTSTGSAIALNRGVQASLEGSWATHCGDDPENGFGPFFEIEFQRSGGSFFSSDGVDLEARGRITAARRDGRDILLDYTYPGPANGIWYLRPVGRDRLEWRENSGESEPAIFRKCHQPNRLPVRKLRSETIVQLSLNQRGGIHFAETEGKERVCATTPKSWLKFDLIGPVSYSVVRRGDFGEEWLQIQESSQSGDEMTLSGTASITEGDQWDKTRKEKRTIRVRWLEQNRVRVEPWGVNFLRCKD